MNDTFYSILLVIKLNQPLVGKLDYFTYLTIALPTVMFNVYL